jgi:hypothetical protein
VSFEDADHHRVWPSLSSKRTADRQLTDLWRPRPLRKGTCMVRLRRIPVADLLAFELNEPPGGEGWRS